MAQGQGVLVYVYDGYEGTDELPATPRVPFAGTDTGADVTVSNLANGQWYLAGNPFYGVTLDWAELGKTNLSGTVYVYDHAYTSGYTNEDVGATNAVGGWRTWNGSAGSLTSGRIAPFQAFFVQANAANGSLTLSRNHAASSTGTLYKNGRLSGSLALSLHTTSSAGVSLRDEAFLSFNIEGETGRDAYDALKLMPHSVQERPLLMLEEGGEGLSIANVPWNAGQRVTLPL